MHICLQNWVSHKQLYTFVFFIVYIDVVFTVGLGPCSPLHELKINLYGTLAEPQIHPVTTLLVSQSHLFQRVSPANTHPNPRLPYAYFYVRVLSKEQSFTHSKYRAALLNAGPDKRSLSRLYVVWCGRVFKLAVLNQAMDSVFCLL